MFLLSKLLNLVRNCKNKFFKHIGRSYFGILLIAEYPKCGGSMLVAILANILNSDNYSDFYSIDSNYAHSQEILTYYDSRNFESYLPNVNLAKTHLPFSFKFKTIICLYRNPLDAIKSYYIMLRSYGRLKDMTLDEFALSPLGIDKYIKFYESYLKAPQSTKIVFISYEDIVSGKLFSLYVALKYLCGRSYQLSLIESVVRDHSLNSAKKHEAEYSTFDLRRYSSSIQFVDNKNTNIAYSRAVKNIILKNISEVLPMIKYGN